jgi:hypothetical protein
LFRITTIDENRPALWPDSGKEGLVNFQSATPRSADEPLEPTMIAAYEKEGIVKLTLPRHVNDLRSELIEELRVWLEAVVGSRYTASDLPNKLAELAKVDRPLLGKLYKLSRRLPSARRMACDRWLIDVAAQVMQTKLVSCCTFVNVRFDLPDEERFLSPIHQDFPYIQGSLNGITIWLPLFDTPVELGPPAWVPGSHGWGVLKVTEFNAKQSNGSGAKSFELAKQVEAGREFGFISAAVAAGEALLFSTLLVHRSCINATEVARVNVQIRFDDALAPESIARNYPEGLYLGDALSTTYPEYVG